MKARIAMAALLVSLLPALPVGATETSTKPLPQPEAAKAPGGFLAPKAPALTGSGPSKSTIQTPTIPKTSGPPRVQQSSPSAAPAKQKSALPSWEQVRPRITSVTRVSRLPGPVQSAFFLNGELLQVRGTNFAEKPTAGFQFGGRVARLTLSSGRRPSTTEFAVFMPSRDILRQAGITVPSGTPVAANLVYLGSRGQVLASYPIRYALRSADSDLDGDGVTIGGGDCNDHDPRIYAGAVELADADGRDEDCNPATYGSVDRDGDGFPDAAMYNVDKRMRRVYRGTDCNDADPTANPIRPENCPAGTSPAERDAALSRR